MNVGILLKGFRETWLLTLLCGFGVFLFEGMVTYVFWIYQEQFTQEILEMDMVRDFVGAMVGSEIGDEVQIGTLDALAWVHPIFLAMLFAHVIAATTRMPAGEIDRATIDFLFAQPIARRSIYLCETIVWLVGGGVIVLFALGGTALGNAFVTDGSQDDMARILLIIANLYAVYVVVGSFSMFVSANVDRRGRAVGIVVGVLMAQFLWNFIGQYWSVAKDLSFLSFLYYFKPMPILGEGAIPYANLSILACFAVLFWSAGLLVFVRRDIRTV